MKKALVIASGVSVLIIALVLVFPYFRYIPEGIIQDPDERLHQVSVEVDEINEETKQIVDELKDVIKKVDGFWSSFGGLGMAAPQIGYNQRILVLRESPGEYQEMINPEVLERKNLWPSPQMCFSTKGLHILNRYFWYKIKYLDIDGKEHVEVITGARAATLNQELDHLNGVLITD